MENKAIQAILIDPTAKEVQFVTLACGNDGEVKLSAIYESMDCSCVTRYRLADDADLILDDEGLLKENYGFRIGDYPQVFAGKALIMGIHYGDDGPSWTGVPNDVNMDGLKELITWAEREEVSEVDLSYTITTL